MSENTKTLMALRNAARTFSRHCYSTPRCEDCCLREFCEYYFERDDKLFNLMSDIEEMADEKLEKQKED